MKTLRLPFLLLLALGVFVYSGCDDDDGDVLVDTLNYDGEPFSAPNADFSEFAAYFPPNETGQFAGRQLETISFYLEQIPDRTIVRVYEEAATADGPGTLIYERDVSQRVNAAPAWIDHRIADDITLGSTGLWLAIEVADDSPGFSFQSIGCDDGANYSPNGDRVRAGGAWTSFQQITGTERVNWNIRGVIAPE